MNALTNAKIVESLEAGRLVVHFNFVPIPSIQKCLTDMIVKVCEAFKCVKPIEKCDITKLQNGLF